MDGTQYIIAMSNLWMAVQHLQSVDISEVAETADRIGTTEDRALLKALGECVRTLPTKNPHVGLFP